MTMTHNPVEARRERYANAAARIEARGERVTTESMRAELNAERAAMLADQNAQADANPAHVAAAVAARDATAGIAEGLQGVVDVLDGSESIRAALPHYDRIEREAAAAQYAIESTLPIRQRARHWCEARLVLLVVALAFLIALIWSRL